MIRSILRTAIVIGMLAGSSAAAQTACDCDQACQDQDDPERGLSFENVEHRLWYERRFWRGRCADGLSWCWSGESWYDVMASTLAGLSPTKRAALCPRLYELGRRIGHEWARDNDIRRISTSDLNAWKDILKNAAEPEIGIEKLEKLSSERLR